MVAVANAPLKDQACRRFRLGRETGTRTQVEQLQAQVEQLQAYCALYEGEIVVLLKELTRARYELAQSYMVDAFAAAPSRSGAKH